LPVNITAHDRLPVFAQAARDFFKLGMNYFVPPAARHARHSERLVGVEE
jgi:hypothetical protein